MTNFSAFYFQLAAAASRNGKPCRGVLLTYICTTGKYRCFEVVLVECLVGKKPCEMCVPVWCQTVKRW